MKRLLLLASALSVLLAGCGDTSPGTERLSTQETAAPAAEAGPAGTPIPSRYIVVFRPHVVDPVGRANVLMQGSGGQTHFTYRSALKGFSATIPDAALQRILSDPDVAYVEQDQVVTLSTSGTTTQDNATWGLDRLDQAALPLDRKYVYHAPTGTSPVVHAFVIDTGIRATHQDFGGRVAAGHTSINDGRGTDDCNGHGTHVAGTVGGTTWGVAKSVRLVPVRVLNCRGSGTWSGVIAGVDYVAGDTRRPAVANMSLGGGASQAVDDAVSNAVSAGVTMVVAAGNDGANACNYSPARTPSAITVGATSNLDARTSWSNFGTCLDVFAPGLSITSAWHKGDTATNTISGTSMASPHVAGVAALLLYQNPDATPASVTTAITGQATAGVTDHGAGSPNLLLYSLATIGDSSSTTSDPPVVTQVGIQQLTGSVKLWKNRWTATVDVAVWDGTTPAAGATVSGTFSPGGSASCTTAGSGTCSVTSAGINNSTGSTIFDVQSISGSNLIDSGTGSRRATIYKDGTVLVE